MLVLFAIAGVRCTERVVDPWSRCHAFAQAHDRSLQGVRWVLVLSDDGCPGCNKDFAHLLAAHADDPKALVVVSATGTRFDIASLLERSGRIIEDDGSFGRSLQLQGSGAIGLNGDRIDTILPLRADALPETFRFIEDGLR